MNVVDRHTRTSRRRGEAADSNYATIDRVESFVIPYREPNDHDSTRFVCLVKVTTAEGSVGWGEAVTLFAEATRATAVLVDGFASLLIGVEANPTTVSAAINSHAWWYGDSGIACFAKAAIDIALWDLMARSRGESLVDALGAAVHASLPIVISCHATDADLGRSAARLAQFVDDQDASGIKVGFGKRGEADLGRDHDRDVEFMRLLRRELGDRPRIMIDIGARIRWSVDEAIRRTKAFEDYGLHWIEEPLGADNPPGYAALGAATDTLIAYGEREWSPRGIRRIVDTGTVDVVGIDPGRAEGVTGFADAAQYIQSAGRQVNAHAFAGPITYAASLALSLASGACHQIEVPPYRNSAYDLTGAVPRPVAGCAIRIDHPGLGVDVDEHAVRAVAL